MDDADGPTASLIFFFCLLLVDIFFYGFSEAVRALNEKEIEVRTENKKDKKSIRLYRIIQDPSRYVNTLQLVITLSNIIMGVWYLDFSLVRVRGFLDNLSKQYFPGVTESTASLLEAAMLVLTMFFVLYIVLTFGVLLPKKLAVRFSEKWAYAIITPMYYFLEMLRPLTGFVTVSVNGVLRLFGLKPNAEVIDVTEEEILSMVNEGHEQGVIEASEAEMISNIFEYGDKEAQDIMTHRSNIIGIDGDLSLKDAIHFMLSEKNSRYPVYEDNIDKIIGILHLKDALRMQLKEGQDYRTVREIEGLLREARFIPLTRNIDDLFKAMQSQKLQMVIVVDEYGQTAGLIAMEDILEEIVGNILDEYDEEDDYIEEKGENEYIIEGKTPLEELEEKFNIHFDKVEFETLNGLLISKLDRIPEQNEEFDIDIDGYNFKILSVENKMIHNVLVTKLKMDILSEKISDDCEKLLLKLEENMEE